MNTPRPHSGAWLFVLVLFGAFVWRSDASIPTVKGKGKLLDAKVLQADAVAVAFTDVYTVPKNRVYVMTDLIVTDSAASTFAQVSLSRIVGAGGDTILDALRVPVNESFSHTFNTGVEFPPNSTINLFTSVGSIHVTINGYLRQD